VNAIFAIAKYLKENGITTGYFERFDGKPPQHLMLGRHFSMVRIYVEDLQARVWSEGLVNWEFVIDLHNPNSFPRILELLTKGP